MSVVSYDPVRDKDARTDWVLPAMIHQAKALSAKNKDDFFVMGFGLPRTGKTTLGFHAYSYYSDAPSIERVAMNFTDFARVIGVLRTKHLDRWTNFDEASVSRRNWNSRENQDIIKLYMAIGGLKGFHWWNSPSLDYMEKQFVEERIKGVFFCFDKESSPRKYWFFTRKGFIRMLEELGTLKVEAVRKHGKKYATYQGWFKSYEGPLAQDYEELKQSKMEEAVESFTEKYGYGRTHTVLSAAALCGVSNHTLKKHLMSGISEGRFERAEHYIQKGARYQITEKGLEALRDEMRGSK